MTSRPPNIVLINCDDLGYGDLGCYGSTANATPAIDSLAAEGLRFTDFYMASPVCSPSRAALLTGCYPPRIGFGDFDGLPVLFPGHRVGLSPAEPTIAATLQAAGYATALIGKWHCGDQPEFLPTRHGFDSFFGLPYSNDMGIQAAAPGQPPITELMRQFGITPPFEEYPPLPLLLDDEVLEQQPDQASLTARYVDQAVRFLRANTDRPFFCYLAHLYVHLPLYVLPRFAERSTNGLYGAAVESIDWATAVILAELDRLGHRDDTIVIFTSDNGSRARDGGSNAPLRGAKGTTWEGGMRVPCIVRWPGKVTAGSTCGELATAMDLHPTLAALAGRPLDHPVDGHDLSGLLVDGDASPHEAFAYYRGNDLEAVRSGHWKLHVARRAGDITELYDLATDPGETTDVHADHPDVVAALSAHAARFRDDLGDARLGITGRGTRVPGVVDAPRLLTVFDPSHPYYAAEYDLSDRG